VSSPEVDAGGVERGLRARVGERLAGFVVEVSPADEEQRVHVSVHRPDGSTVARTIDLRGETIEARSRELAAALAILVDQYEPPPPPRPAAPAGPRPGFFLLLGPRLGLGRPADPDLGGTFVAGLSLAGEHVQPRLSGSWSAAWRRGLFLHGARFGGGLAGGAPLARGHLWVGGAAIGQAAWVQARDVRNVDAWVAVIEVGPLLQARARHFVAELRTGVELMLPPVRAHGRAADLRFGYVRWLIGLSVGPRF
jgi:hypothetical protein